jgi:hypothetical protein
MRKISLAAIASLAVLAWVGPSHAAIQNFVANLDSDQEVPSNASTAKGRASLSINDSDGSYTLFLDVTGITKSQVTFTAGGLRFAPDGAGPLHIHTGAPGVNGPIAVRFPSADFFTDKSDGSGMTILATGLLNFGGSATLESTLTAINAGNAYFNLHTLSFPGGEIRGQLAASEPATLLIMAGGLLGLAYATRRRSAS